MTYFDFRLSLPCFIDEKIVKRMDHMCSFKYEEYTHEKFIKIYEMFGEEFSNGIANFMYVKCKTEENKKLGEELEAIEKRKREILQDIKLNDEDITSVLEEV